MKDFPEQFEDLPDRMQLAFKRYSPLDGRKYDDVEALQISEPFRVAYSSTQYLGCYTDLKEGKPGDYLAYDPTFIEGRLYIFGRERFRTEYGLSAAEQLESDDFAKAVKEDLRKIS